VSKKSGKGKVTCLHCGRKMKDSQARCKQCGRQRMQGKSAPARPASTPAVIYKSRGSNVVPIGRAKGRKRDRPKCPVCLTRAKSMDGNCCHRCGRAYSLQHSDRAEKSATAYRAQFAGTPESYEARAAASWNPAEREALRAEADKARKAWGGDAAYQAQMLVKAHGALSLREAWMAETDPRARQILRDVMDGRA
jgi:hypothetical protein